MTNFGFSPGGHFQGQDPATIERELREMKRLGARWLRFDVNWAQIQRGGPDEFDWSLSDRVYSLAGQFGLNVLGMIGYTPGWAGPSDRHPPDDLRHFARFCRKVARRYGPRAYEIWNEPNIVPFWRPAPDPEAYAELLRRGYRAIKKADRLAFVLCGGTSPAPDADGNYAPATWLARLLSAGARFDAVSHHPYCWPALPSEPRDWSAWTQMNALWTVMQDYGKSKQIWATEFGAPTDGPTGVTESWQADSIRDALRTWDSYRWAGPLFIYSFRDLGTNTSTREDWFGVLRHDFSRKPAANVLEAA